MSEFQERTQRATPHRRHKLRAEGKVPRSRELISVAGMAGVLGTFVFAGPFFMERISLLTGNLLGFRYGTDPFDVMRAATIETALIVAPFFLAAAVFSVLATVAQGGLILKPLSLDLTRLNPTSGLKRMFGLQGLGGVLKNLLKFVIGGVVLYIAIKKTIPELPITAAMDMRESIRTSTGLIGRAVAYACGTFFVLAIADYVYEWWQFERSIRMTKEEIKEEMKETEGDPVNKSRVRSAQREMARRRMMQAVPKATVVITNPTHIAVALSYVKEEMSAPTVVAKGAGFVAENIKNIARSHGVPIVEDKPLARALYKVPLDTAIPEKLYRAVAKILAYIYKLRKAA